MASLTKMAIIRAFAHLASTRTVDKITVKDISELCGISRNTFYYHYKDIDVVLKEFMKYATNEIIARIEGSGDDSRQAYRVIMEEMLDIRGLLLNLFRSVGNAEVRKYLEDADRVLFDHIIENLSREIPVSEADKRLISQVCQYACRGIMLEWLERDEGKEGEAPLVELFMRVQYLFDGVIEEALRRSAEQNAKNSGQNLK